MVSFFCGSCVLEAKTTRTNVAVVVKMQPQKYRNRFPDGKRKSPRKDRSQSIEEMNVSNLDLAELKESKALHEEWAAFRSEHRETIENDSSTEDYDWLERQTFQNIHANNMDNYFEHSRSKMPTKKKLADLATHLMDKMEAIKKKYPHLPKNTKKLKKEVRRVNKLFREHSKLKASKKILNGYVRELNTLNGKIAAVKEFNILKERVARLLSRIKHKKYSGSQFLASDQKEGEIESLCKRWKELGIATEPIGLETPLWILWKQGGNSPELLRAESTRNGERMRQAQGDIRSARKIIASRKKDIASQMEQNSYTEPELKRRMKDLKKEARKGDVSSILTRNSIKLYLKEIKLQQKNIEIYQDIRRSLRKRNEKLWAYIKRMLFPQRKKRIATRLLTPQEAENVIFW